jgi:RNA polymerase sigma factor (sigma-70 family)
MRRRTEGYRVNGKDAKEVDDLADHYSWMVGRARMRVSAADADDVANKALYDAHHPTGNRPPASEVPRVKLWLDELIDLRARAHRKNMNKHEPEVLSDKVHSLVPHSADTDVEMQYADREWVRIALESLPKDRRELIVQCYLKEIPIEEVARSLGEKTNTIHTRLRRIRADLRMKLDQLVRVSRRGLRLVFPFLFLRWLWKRTSGRVLDACAGKIRRTVDGVFVAPGPLAFGVIAVAFVLGFDSSDPHAEASEQAASSRKWTVALSRGEAGVERRARTTSFEVHADCGSLGKVPCG